MVNLLLNRIKELENRLEEITEKNIEAKEEILSLFKQCKIEKDKKDSFKKKLLNALEKIETKEIKNFFNQNYLKYNTFIEIAKNLNSGYLVIINADYPQEIKKFILGFLLNKISPFFTLDNNKIIAVFNIICGVNNRA